VLAGDSGAAQDAPPGGASAPGRRQREDLVQHREILATRRPARGGGVRAHLFGPCRPAITDAIRRSAVSAPIATSLIAGLRSAA
jgi:hypothetical protein